MPFLYWSICRFWCYDALMATKQAQGVILKPSEVAALFGVDPKTVARWAKEGKIPSFKTPGGHRRFIEEEVHRLIEGELGNS